MKCNSIIALKNTITCDFVWKKWGNRSLSKFNKGQCRILQVGINNPVEAADQPAGKQPCRKRAGILVENKLDMSQQCASAAKVSNSILGCVRKSEYRLNEVILPLSALGMATPEVLGPVLCFPVQGRHGKTGTRPAKVHKDGKGLEHLSYEEAGKAGTCHLREGSWKNLINVHKQPNERRKEDRGKPFWVVSCESARGNQHKFTAVSIKIY